MLSLRFSDEERGLSVYFLATFMLVECGEVNSHWRRVTVGLCMLSAPVQAGVDPVPTLPPPPIPAEPGL